MDETPKPDDVMTSREVAKFLRISMKTFYRMAGDGVIAHARLSGLKNRYSRKRLVEWIENGGKTRRAA